MKEENERLSISPIPVYPLLGVKNFYTVIYTTYSDGFVFPGERHHFREISYVDDGVCTVTTNDDTYICRKGDMILHSPDSFHSMWVERGESCRLLTLTFDLYGSASDLFPGKYTSSSSENAVFDGIIGHLVKLFGDDAHGDLALTRAFSSVSADDVHVQSIRTLLELLCLSLIERGKSARDMPSSDASALCYAKIMAYLRDNADKNLTVDDVSRGVYESPGKVKEVFRRFTGCGVMKYFHSLRISRVMELLSAGHSVKDIASVMDFSSPYYLSYYFKRETGMTVRAYLENKK